LFRRSENDEVNADSSAASDLHPACSVQ
jgi:hypothetical protein